MGALAVGRGSEQLNYQLARSLGALGRGEDAERHLQGHRESRDANDRRERAERARETLSGGVASSYQLRDPWPIYLSHGKGPRVWDVDGNVMLDFHNGFGSMVQGHAHPAISKAAQSRVALGTHFAAPTEDAVVVGEELARRWGLPKWRYVNSGLRRRWTRSDRPRLHRPTRS